MSTITYSKTLVVVDCCACAIVFAVPRDFDRENREKGQNRTWYCPNGHSQHYTRSEIADLGERLKREQRWREEAETRARAAFDQAEAAQRSASAYKGQVTKIKKRVANGVCPCCKRTFANLARHMEGQHPDFEEIS